MFAGRGDNPLAAVLEEVVQKQEGLVSPAPVCAGILEEIEQMTTDLKVNNLISLVLKTCD